MTDIVARRLPVTDIVDRLKDVSFCDPEYPLYREAAERIEFLQSTEANEILRLRNDLTQAVKLLDALLGLDLGSSEAALAFVERYRSSKGGSANGLR